MRNVLAVLEAAGATQEDVAKLTIYLHADLIGRRGLRRGDAGLGPHPTAVTVVQVASFARPGVVCEIDAVASLG